MIGRLQGTVWKTDKLTNTVILNVQQTGYEINVTEKLIDYCASYPMEQLLIFEIQTIVREDSFELFGFLNNFDKQLFNLLRSVSGIGSKIALGILNAVSTNKFIQIIHNKNISQLIRFPGIGNKTASRLLLELPDKLHKIKLTGSELDNSILTSHHDVSSEAIAGLVNLGYKLTHAEQMVSQIISESGGVELNTSTVLRQALQRVGTKTTA